MYTEVKINQKSFLKKIINFFKKKKLLTKDSRNHLKMQKSVIFVKKNLKIYLLKVTKIVKLETIAVG